MKESRLDNELERIYKTFPFLWKNHRFNVTYLTRDYGMYYRGFIIGLGNDVCNLVFKQEANSPVESVTINIGRKRSSFTPPNFSFYAKDGWYPICGLIYWLSGIECERDNNVDQDLENISEYLRLHMDKALDLFKFPDDLERKLEYYRNLYREKQITAEKIREERARLQALGLNASLEAAITNLRRGKK